jgi:hypothetical protein
VSSRHRAGTRAIALGLLSATAMGCSLTARDPSPSVTTGSSAPTIPGSNGSSSLSATASASEDRASAYAELESEITAFLEAWRDKGYATASQIYLVPNQQPQAGDSGEPLPVLVAGRILTFRQLEWTSGTNIVVNVDLDLEFKGYAGAWGNGKNNRFVSATARTGAIPYILEFDSSP